MLLCVLSVFFGENLFCRSAEAGRYVRGGEVFNESA